MTRLDVGLDVLIPRQPGPPAREQLPARRWHPDLHDVAGLVLAVLIVLVAVGACACILIVWARA